MAKHPEELTIELVPEKGSPAFPSEENKVETPLDSLLSLSEVSFEKGGTKIKNNRMNTRETSPLSKEDDWVEGKDSGKLPGIVVGRLIEVNDQCQPLVEFPGNLEPNPLLARTTVAIVKSNIQQETVLMFERGDPRKPIIMGILSSSHNNPPESDKVDKSEQIEPTNVDIDGERMTFTAKKEIVLKCGKASITLTKAGKILIRGAYLLSRSSGANRIKGGSVQLN